MRRVQEFCEITTLDLSHVVTVKSTVEISQNFVAFSEYMSFTQPPEFGYLEKRAEREVDNLLLLASPDLKG